jgi:hypothetical protein
MLCNLTIAADNATFGEPEVRFSSVGPAIVMPMIIRYQRARELLYFGDTIDAKSALDLGMVNRIVPLAELRTANLRYAKRLSLISPEALYGPSVRSIAAPRPRAPATGFTPGSTLPARFIIARSYSVYLARTARCRTAVGARRVRSQWVTRCEVIRPGFRMSLACRSPKSSIAMTRTPRRCGMPISRRARKSSSQQALTRCGRLAAICRRYY